MGTSTTDDDDLLQQADAGDLDALRQLIAGDLHPAWRIAVIATGSAEAAERAAVEGFCDGLTAAIRQPDARIGLRTRLVTVTRHAAITDAPAAPSTATPDPDPVVAAFRALPEAWRTALWLVEVEGGSPEQVAPVLGLNRSAAAALADRAAAGLRERLAADIAERATEVECRRALAKLPAHASGKLTAAERAAVGDHLATCGSCAVWLAALVSPRPALRRLITPPPAAVTMAIEARWLFLLEKRGRSWLTPLTERAVGAVAAAVLAIGLGGAAVLGGRDDDPAAGPQLAVPVASSPEPIPPAGATVVVLPPPISSDTTSSVTGGPPPAPNRGGGSSSDDQGTSGTRGTDGDEGIGEGNGKGSDELPRSLRPGPGPADGPAATSPPSTSPPPPPGPPPADEAALGVPGVVEITPAQRTVGVEIVDTVTVEVGDPDLVQVGIAGL